jgi:hypothetical protein
MIYKFVKRNKGFSAGVTAAVLALLFSTLFLFNAWWEVRQAKDESDRAHREMEKAHAEKEQRTKAAVPGMVVVARGAANASKWKAARDQIDLALLYDPHDPDAHLLKGQILLGQKDWIAAEGELEQYVEKKPKDADARTLLDLCRTGNVNDPATRHALAEVLGRQNMPGPALPLLKEVAVERKTREPLVPVLQKQVEANWPGLGRRLSLREDGRFDLSLQGCRQVASLEPLKSLPLGTLNLRGCTQVSDLSPLKGMQLTELDLCFVEVDDLRPLRGLPQLRMLDLTCNHRVSDLSALKDLPLRDLRLWGCQHVRDLSPLRDIPLSTLILGGGCGVKDLTPVERMELVSVVVSPQDITKGLDVLRRKKTLAQIDVRWPPKLTPDEFWKRYDDGEFK